MRSIGISATRRQATQERERNKRGESVGEKEREMGDEEGGLTWQRDVSQKNMNVGEFKLFDFSKVKNF